MSCPVCPGLAPSAVRYRLDKVDNVRPVRFVRTAILHIDVSRLRSALWMDGNSETEDGILKQTVSRRSLAEKWRRGPRLPLPASESQPKVAL